MGYSGRMSTFNVTESAAQKVAELLQSEDDPELKLRVAVRPGGCSGFSYEMFFDSAVEEDDRVEEHGPVRVIIDPTSSTLLDGATLDYKDGLEAGFHVSNPNAQRTCGCGQSFS